MIPLWVDNLVVDVPFVELPIARPLCFIKPVKDAPVLVRVSGYRSSRSPLLMNTLNSFQCNSLLRLSILGLVYLVSNDLCPIDILYTSQEAQGFPVHHEVARRTLSVSLV